ncbi:MAG TPA: DUF2786 domain-containing protein [Acidimicrobiales bacterium]|nr:DUF2786 domain-containing protein [Acidimicrobiales bacterium]
MIDALVKGGPRTCTRLTSMLVSALASLLRDGWEPHEIVRVVRKRAGLTASKIIAMPLIEAVGCCDENDRLSWGKQLSLLNGNARLDPSLHSWASDLDGGIAALGLLDHLPPMPNLGPAGQNHSDNAGPQDRQILTKVRGLLAKAESTEFPEEADALMAKAQELMTRHCIDKALVDGNGDGSDLPRLETRRCWLDDPYVDAKVVLLSVVARANRCRSVGSPEIGMSTLVGHPDDVEVTELLFTSLLVQAIHRITSLSSDPIQAASYRKPSFRRSFLVAYAYRIGRRLAEVSQATVKNIDEHEGGRFLPVLAKREEAVDEAVEMLFGDLTSYEVSARNSHGFAAGVAAADMAELVMSEGLESAAKL